MAEGRMIKKAIANSKKLAMTSTEKQMNFEFDGEPKGE